MRQCLERGWNVDCLIHSKRDKLIQGIGTVWEKIEDSKAKRYDYIFNAAAFIPYGKYTEANSKLLEVNATLQEQLQNFQPKGKTIYASSVAVYGDNFSVLTEQSLSKNPNLYGQSKLAGEQIAATHDSFAIVRFPSLYGKGMFDGTFIPAIIRDAKSKKQIRLSGDGSRLQNYLHIADAARYCIAAAIQGDNDIYLGTAPQSNSNQEVAQIIADQYSCEIIYCGKDESPSFRYNNSYTLTKLRGSEPLIGLAEGLKDLL